MDRPNSRKVAPLRTGEANMAVPDDQLPVVEFEQLLEQPMFDIPYLTVTNDQWDNVLNNGLYRWLTGIYVASLAGVCYPIACATYTSQGMSTGCS